MTANSTPESFDAVLAEMRDSDPMIPPFSTVTEWADRLQSAHARELAGQQATIEALRSRADAAIATLQVAKGLVANWREEASHMDYGPGYRENMEDCADELEQALAGGERKDG